MDIVSLDDEITDHRSVNVSKIKKYNLLNKSKSKPLIKFKQMSRTLTRSTDKEFSELNDNCTIDELVDNKTIHLSSIIFTPNNSLTTIQELKRKIQTWSITHCRGKWLFFHL